MGKITRIELAAKAFEETKSVTRMVELMREYHQLVQEPGDPVPPVPPVPPEPPAPPVPPEPPTPPTPPVPPEFVLTSPEPEPEPEQVLRRHRPTEDYPRNGLAWSKSEDEKVAQWLDELFLDHSPAEAITEVACRLQRKSAAVAHRVGRGRIRCTRFTFNPLKVKAGFDAALTMGKDINESRAAEYNVKAAAVLRHRAGAINGVDPNPVEPPDMETEIDNLLYKT